MMEEVKKTIYKLISFRKFCKDVLGIKLRWYHLIDFSCPGGILFVIEKRPIIYGGIFEGEDK